MDLFIPFFFLMRKIRMFYFTFLSIPLRAGIAAANGLLDWRF
jgi:hypothetical protein